MKRSITRQLGNHLEVANYLKEIFHSQIEWLFNVWNYGLGYSLRRSDDNSTLKRHIESKVSAKQSIVLVKRSKTRQLGNHLAVANYLKQIAISNNLNFVIHDDSNLPPLIDQIRTFSNARLIVAPHGAANLFMTFATGWINSTKVSKDINTVQHRTTDGKKSSINTRGMCLM